MGFLALDDRSDKNRKIGNPDNGQPKIDIPFRLCIFFALADAEQIARCRKDDEKLVAPKYKPGETGEGKSRPAGALNHVKARGDQRITTERKDDRRCMQRPQAPECRIFKIEIECRKGELKCDVKAGQEACQPPKNRSYHPETYKIVVIGRSGLG